MYRQSEKDSLNSNIFPTCLHNIVIFDPLAAEIGSVVWGTPANFNAFRILASLLHRRRSTEANQTLHDVWPSPGLVHDIYIFGGSCLVTEFCHVQNSLCVQVLRSPILAALLHGTRVVGVRQALRRWAEGATYIRQRAGRLSRWAYAHILVLKLFFTSQKPWVWSIVISSKSIGVDIKPIINIYLAWSVIASRELLSITASTPLVCPVC